MWRDSTQSDEEPFYCLGEKIRLLSVLLICKQSELCVCELMVALNENQSKISRHLAQLRNCNLLQDRRQGQWVFYRLHPELSPWALRILDEACRAEASTLRTMEQRLHAMQDRPTRDVAHA